MYEWTRYVGMLKSGCWSHQTGGRSMQCKYNQILLGWTCEWSLWRSGCFIEVDFKTGLTVVEYIQLIPPQLLKNTTKFLGLPVISKSYIQTNSKSNDYWIFQMFLQRWVNSLESSSVHMGCSRTQADSYWNTSPKL